VAPEVGRITLAAIRFPWQFAIAGERSRRRCPRSGPPPRSAAGPATRPARGLEFGCPATDSLVWPATDPRCRGVDRHRHRRGIPGRGPSTAHHIPQRSSVTDIGYRIDRPHNLAEDLTIAHDDPCLGIRWPLPLTIMSERDRTAPALADLAEAPRVSASSSSRQAIGRTTAFCQSDLGLGSLGVDNWAQRAQIASRTLAAEASSKQRPSGT
jgi:hypothetical protein